MATSTLQAADTAKYLTFNLAEETYGLPILTVREIIGLMQITRVPRMPEFVRGVINLRGKVIPVIDLRVKFGLPGIEDTKEACIIVVDVENMLMGVKVDMVSEVMDIGADRIEDTPSFGVQVDTRFISGLGKAKEKVVIILDIAKVLTTGELAALAETAGGNQ